jgi:hypothetical protein
MGKSTFIVLLGLLVAASPSAASESSEAIAFSLGTSALMSLACWSLNTAGAEAEEQPAPDAYDRRGWYAGVGGTWGIGTFDDEHMDGDDVSWGANARAGYRCNGRLSNEIEVEWLDGFDRSITHSPLHASFESLFISDNVKGYLLTGRYQPFLMAGFGFLKMDAVTKNGDAPYADRRMAALRLGLGADIYVTKQLVASLDLSHILPVTGNTEFKYYTVGLGLQYRF